MVALVDIEKIKHRKQYIAHRDYWLMSFKEPPTTKSDTEGDFE